MVRTSNAQYIHSQIARWHGDSSCVAKVSLPCLLTPTYVLSVLYTESTCPSHEVIIVGYFRRGILKAVKFSTNNSTVFPGRNTTPSPLTVPYTLGEMRYDYLKQSNLKRITILVLSYKKMISSLMNTPLLKIIIPFHLLETRSLKQRETQGQKI